ncbi:MAG: radical SAM family heme chaperone HemW [Acutalibacteraceae bacterium]
MTDKAPLGLYLHIPFCAKKCAYCDFYSAFAGKESLDSYAEGLISQINKWGGRLCRPLIDTVYLGGGTPSLLAERIIPVIDSVKKAFCLAEGAEITLEINPAGDVEKILFAAKMAGVSRLSVGAQSGDNAVLSLLGRTHTAEDTLNTVKAARKMGFNNISLDLMIGLPDSDLTTLKADLDFVLSAKPEHISAYILKLEENTLFYKKRDTLNLPDGDETAEQYLYMCRYLEEKGFSHYEISNFAKEGFEGRHNLKYWQCREYLGIGPSAHSFLAGERFYYPRDSRAFLRGEPPISDGKGGDREEYIMLSLRLKEGLVFQKYRERFNEELPEGVKKAALPLEKAGLLNLTDGGISLTDRGMLLSNSIITNLLECL